jgi:hypothetical protein
VGQNALVDRPDDIEIGVREGLQAIERAKQVFLDEALRGDIAAVGGLKLEGGGARNGGAESLSARARIRPSRSST